MKGPIILSLISRARYIEGSLYQENLKDVSEAE